MTFLSIEDATLIPEGVMVTLVPSSLRTQVPERVKPSDVPPMANSGNADAEVSAEIPPPHNPEKFACTT
jgi:hypothetical protein